jgi:hypothetical protein
VLVALLAAFIVPSSAQGGSNGWQLCNNTSYVVEAATGRPDSEDVIVEGWTRIRPGQCEIALPGPLKPGMIIAIEQGAVVNGTRVAFEDDVLVTATGHEWLTRSIPIEIDEVDCRRLGVRVVHCPCRCDAAPPSGRGKSSSRTPKPICCQYWQSFDKRQPRTIHRCRLGCLGSPAGRLGKQRTGIG